MCRQVTVRTGWRKCNALICNLEVSSSNLCWDTFVMKISVVFPGKCYDNALRVTASFPIILNYFYQTFYHRSYRSICTELKEITHTIECYLQSYQYKRRDAWHGNISKFTIKTFIQLIPYIIVTDNNSPKYAQFLYLRSYITLRNYKLLYVSIPVGSLPGVCKSNNLV
jgi:hypothetical protein